MRAENGMFKLRQRWSSSNIAAHIKKIKDKGFFHIFFANVINKFVSFFTVFALVRILSKQTYGEWSYALNIISIILLFQGMGSVPALLQYCSSAQSTSQIHSYFKFGIRVGLVSNIVLAGRQVSPALLWAGSCAASFLHTPRSRNKRFGTCGMRHPSGEWGLFRRCKRSDPDGKKR